MRKLFCALFALVAVGFSSTAAAQSTLKPADLALLGYYDVQTFGNDTSYMRSLTHRYVNGQLRFLSLTHTGQLQEFAPAAAYGQRIGATTATWNISSVTGDFTGIWWDDAKQRLWVTASVDYGNGDQYYPTRISTLTLGANGAVGNVKTVSLQGITSKRAYGGVVPVPAWFQAQYGCGPYAVGFGGYTSLLLQTSKPSLGPELICIPDTAGYANGAEIPASAFKVLLDMAPGTHGVRKTFPLNYFDGGDPRPNPSTPPTSAPLASAQFLSPNAQGLGWMVWGDSYYNNAVWIDTPSMRGFLAVAALCSGKCWYQESTLHFDGRTQEAHIWDPSSLVNGAATQPTSMAELMLPRGNDSAWSGDVPASNISGVTFDATTNTLYLIGFPLGPDVYTGRLYAMSVGSGSTPPPVDTTAPTVALTGPVGGTTVSGTVALSATASDSVGVSSVWFTVDGVTSGAEDASAPYQGNWNAATATTGSHIIRALARDAAGNAGTSAAMTVTIAAPAPGDTTAPTVAITAPVGGTTVSGTVALSATASDNVGVSSVSFTVDGVTVGSGDASAPYQGSWNAGGATAGSHVIRAVARDAAGNAGTSAAVTVTIVAPAPGDTSAPTVAMTGPVGGTVSGTVALSATASDNVGVSSVSFTVDGVTVGGADASAPYQGSWNAGGATAGSHVIRAVARDAAGNVGTSAPMDVTIASSGPSLPTFIVIMDRKSHRGQCKATISGPAPDSTTGWAVRFTRDGSTFGSVDATAPYSQTGSVPTGASTFGAVWTKGAGHDLTTLTAPNLVATCQ